MNREPSTKHSVLIADDSTENRFFIERALCYSSRLQVVGSVRNGTEVIQYLTGQDRFSDRKLWPIPDLLLLDITTPRTGGFEVLEWLQARKIPGLRVVVLSRSCLEKDIADARRTGINAFFTDNEDFGRLFELVRSLENFLLGSAPSH
jgi:CheY-like chemotaxis protein